MIEIQLIIIEIFNFLLNIWHAINRTIVIVKKQSYAIAIVPTIAWSYFDGIVIFIKTDNQQHILDIDNNEISSELHSSTHLPIFI